MEKKIKTIIIFLLTWMVTSTFAFAQDGLSEVIQDLVSPAVDCQGGTLDQCPSFNEKRLSEFVDGRLVSNVPYSTCMNKEEFSLGDFFNDVTAEKLDAAYNDNSYLFNGGEFKNFGQTCVSTVESSEEELRQLQDSLTSFQERQAVSEGRCENYSSARVQSRCQQSIGRSRLNFINRSIPKNRSKVKIADNYLSHLKLRTALEESLRSVNLIDLMTNPELLLDGVDCEKSPYPQSKTLCENLKSDQCRQREKAKKLREDHLELTRNSLLQIRSLKLRKKELNEELNKNYQGGRGRSLRRRFPEKYKELESLEEKMALYTSQAPWIGGEKFKNIIDFSNDSDSKNLDKIFSEGNEENFDKLVAEAFDAQMKDNRNNLKGQIEDFNKASFCLKGEGDCDLKETNEIIDRTPQINLSKLDVPFKKPLEFVQCLNTETKKANEQAEFVKEIGIGVGLTVASVFVPPLGIARVAQLGSTAIRGVGSIARLRAAGQLSSAAAVIAGDIYYASESFGEAYEQCSSDQQSNVSFESDSQIMPSSGPPSCEVENQKLAERIQHVPTKCLSSLLYAGVDSIPFVAFASSQALRAARQGRGLPEGRTLAMVSEAGSPTRHSEVISSIGNVDTGDELLRFKQAFNDDVLKRVGLDGLQNYDNPEEIKAYRNVLERFLEPGQGFIKDGELNSDLIQRINDARALRGLDPLGSDELASLREVGEKWDITRDAFGTERVKLADLRSQALKRELSEMDLPDEQIKDVNCEKLSRLSPGFSTKGQSCFGFRTGDPQPEKMRGQFCSCGSYNSATNWLIRCPKNRSEFLRASNYYDQLGLFKNETLNCFRVNIPNNTTCFAGAAGPRRGGLGGMSQIFCPNRIQGDFKVNWGQMSPEEIRAKIASSKELWNDLGVPEDWVLRSPDPNALSGNARADAVGASFRDYMVSWSPNPQDKTMASWVDKARDCVQFKNQRGPCDVAQLSVDYEEVLESYADYNPKNKENPWKVREGSNVTQEEFDSFRTYTCQYLFKSSEADCAGVEFVKFNPDAVNFGPTN